MARLVLVALLGGCILPVSTGAPLPPTTVGRGNVGFSLSSEAPVVDLIASDPGSGKTIDYASSYGESPAAGLTATLSIGLGDDTDLELGGEGALYYYFLPIPTGGAIGLRHHLLGTDAIDLGVALRIGGVTSGSTTKDPTTGNAQSDSGSAIYGAAQVIIQRHTGVLRPLAAINVMPFDITRGITDEPIQHFKGVATSLTVCLCFTGDQISAGPYITVTDFESQTFAGGRFASGGLMLTVRPDRSRVLPPLLLPPLLPPRPAPLPSEAPPTTPPPPPTEPALEPVVD